MIIDNLIITPLKIDDIEQVRIWRNSSEVSDFMYSSEHITSEMQNKWFRKITGNQSCEYYIVEFQNTKVGVVYFFDINQVLQSCYWGFYLADEIVRGKGVGSKIEIWAINKVFYEMKLNKLRCEVFTFNEKVIRMHEKFGFRREAFYREHCQKKEKFEDVVGLALLKREWEILKSTMEAKYV